MTSKMLYKYRSFNDRTLAELLDDKMFYANPTSFNDPMDTVPHLAVDIESRQLKDIFERLFISNRIGDTGIPSVYSRVLRDDAESEIADIQKRNATAHSMAIILRTMSNNGTWDDIYEQLSGAISMLLREQHHTGIVSLSERYNSLLMWSHYGDQHRGICIGYKIGENGVDNLRQVSYLDNRAIAASLVLDMLNGNDEAFDQVFEAVNLSKAPDWGYEQEWRLTGKEGLHDTPDSVDTKLVLFGIRCPDTVRYSIMKALEDRQEPIAFQEMVEARGTFGLEKTTIVLGDQRFGQYPRKRQTATEMFGTPSPPPPSPPPSPPEKT